MKNQIIRNVVFLCAALVFSPVFLSAADTSTIYRISEMDLKSLTERAAQLNDQIRHSPANEGAAYDLGIVYCFMAIKDSKAYAQPAVDRLDRLHQKMPNDALILCYLGNVNTLIAKESWNPLTKSIRVKRGVEYMDAAVKMEPINIEVRMMRGNNSRNLPAFLDRRPVAYEDLTHVAELLQKDPKAHRDLKVSVYRTLSAMHREDGNKAQSEKFGRLADAAEHEK